MGKSKRIRSERARSIAANPEKYASAAKNGSKKSKVATIVIIALVAALLLGAIAGMMGDAKITMLQSMMDGVTQKDFAKLNRLLSRVKK